ncbi:MAG: heme-binding protein [Phyllobacteriaceae bacterium]|nr:heme-binding protein [Phyllobacteriaceae bacterium]
MTDRSHSRTQPVLRYQSAQALVAHAMDHAEKNAWRVAVAVLDPGGHMLAAGRMDDVPAPILDIATDKTFTATLGKTSLAFGERMASSKPLELGLSTRQRLLAWEGGVPIREDGALIGAIGVSGARGHEDAACAMAAIEALSLEC